MSFRHTLLAHCDYPDCGRSTTADARLVQQVELDYYDVHFTPGPYGKESGWVYNGVHTLCPDHAPKEKS